MKLIMIGVISIFLSPLPLVVYGQDKGPQGRIVLEEEEVTLFDENGKEIEKRYVSKEGTEKAAIRRIVREKALKRMGRKSLDEIKRNGEFQKYLKEQSKFIKVKKLKPENLKFVGKNGNIIREIPIGYRTIVSTFNAETIKSQKTFWGDKLLPGRKYKQQIMRNPILSKSQKNVVIAEMVQKFAIAESSTEERMFDGTDAANLGIESSLEYYDEKGDMRWKKILIGISLFLI